MDRDRQVSFNSAFDQNQEREHTLSNIKKGVKFLSWGVPILLLTVAPAPSACSLAKTDWMTVRDTRAAEVILGLSFGGVVRVLVRGVSEEDGLVAK